jgi:O-acetyl-ADP-ribose deacetylase (regulator of RNase III)
MRLIKIESTGQRIGYPKIGAGLAGGDWEIIAAIIEEELLANTVARFPIETILRQSRSTIRCYSSWWRSGFGYAPLARCVGG